MKKKIFSILIIAVMLMGSLFVFTGCGDDDEEETTSSKKKNKVDTSVVDKYGDDDEDDKKTSSNKNKNDDDEDDKKTSSNKNKNDDDEDDKKTSSSKNKNDDDEDDKKSSSSTDKNTSSSSSNTGNKNTSSNSSKKDVIKIIATNSELSKSLGEVQGISYGDIKITIDYNKSTEEIVGAQIAMSINVTDKNMLTALEGMDLSTLFQAALSGQDYIKNAKTEKVGNTINFYADMDVEAAMEESGKRTVSLEELKEGMKESSFKVTIEE